MLIAVSIKLWVIPSFVSFRAHKFKEKFEDDERYIMATNDKDLKFQLDQLVGVSNLIVQTIA